MKDGFVGQFDVLDQPTGRRNWPDEVKSRIIMESFPPGALWAMSPGGIGCCRRN